MTIFLPFNFSHVCYAPELETVDDTRYKLMQRQREIAGKLNPLVNNRKRSHQPSLLVQSSSTGSNISEEANSHDEIRLPTLEPNCSLSETVPVQFPSPSKNSKKTAAIPAVKRIVYHQSRKKPNAGLNVSRTTNQSKMQKYFLNYFFLIDCNFFYSIGYFFQQLRPKRNNKREMTH